MTALSSLRHSSPRPAASGQASRRRARPRHMSNTPDRLDALAERISSLEDSLARLGGALEIVARKAGLPAWDEETESFDSWLSRIEEAQP